MPSKRAFELARFIRRVPDPREVLGYRPEWRDACLAGRVVHEWRKDRDAERVIHRRFSDEAAARAFFRALARELAKTGHEARAATSAGWTINPRGQRGYFHGTSWGSAEAWSRGVAVATVSGANEPRGGAAAAAAGAPADRKRPSRAALTALARKLRLPPPTAPIAKLIDATNSWFAALVAAGMSLDQFAGADRDPRAIVTSGPYTAGEIRDLEERLAASPPRSLQLAHPISLSGIRLPRSWVALLREHGDLAVLAGPHGRDATYPLRSRAGWPLVGTLDRATHTLNWEIERHAEPGSFTPAQLAKRHWLRFGGNAPGASDHSFILDLDLLRRGEPAIYRVPDVDSPTTIDTAATVFGPRRWLDERIRHLRSLVAAALAA